MVGGPEGREDADVPELGSPGVEAPPEVLGGLHVAQDEPYELGLAGVVGVDVDAVDPEDGGRPADLADDAGLLPEVGHLGDEGGRDGQVEPDGSPHRSHNLIGQVTQPLYLIYTRGNLTASRSFNWSNSLGGK